MEAQIKDAWTRFVKDGELLTGKLRRVVSRSWKRSAMQQLSFSCRQAPILSDGELNQQRLKCADILSAATLPLVRARNLLLDTNSMLILANERGFILAGEGDLRTIDAGHDNHLEPGGDWNELSIGTNAIGTALTERTAVYIHGNEHYCEGIQHWSCAAVPIFNPVTRQLIGVVDVSGPAISFNPPKYGFSGFNRQ